MPLLPKSAWIKPVSPPPLHAHPTTIRALIRRLQTPRQVQQWIASLHYNPRDTMRTFAEVVRTKQAHCLEAALSAATILEYHGYPPLILDLESADRLDHTLFLYRQKGRYGTVGMSRDIGLAGRKPVYPNLRSLVHSYAAPYIDHKASLKRYGVLDLRMLKGGWRFAKTNVWFVEEELRRIPHQRLTLPSSYTQNWRRKYAILQKLNPNRRVRFYPNGHNWVER